MGGNTFRRLMICLPVLLALVPVAHAMPGWQYQRVIQISSSAVQDAAVQINVNLSTLIAAGKLRADYADLRFTDASGNQLPWWIENSQSVWVQVDLPAGPSQIYMYYGNPNANHPGWTCSSVFYRCDEFSGSLESFWLISQGASQQRLQFGCENGYLKLTPPDWQPWWGSTRYADLLMTSFHLPPGYEARIQVISATYPYCSGTWFAELGIDGGYVIEYLSHLGGHFRIVDAPSAAIIQESPYPLQPGWLRIRHTGSGLRFGYNNILFTNILSRTFSSVILYAQQWSCPASIYLENFLVYPFADAIVNVGEEVVIPTPTPTPAPIPTPTPIPTPMTPNPTATPGALVLPQLSAEYFTPFQYNRDTPSPLRGIRFDLVTLSRTVVTVYGFFSENQFLAWIAAFAIIYIIISAFIRLILRRLEARE